MSQYAQDSTKKSAQFVEIVYSWYFHKHVDHIQRRNSWDTVSFYVTASTYSKLDQGFSSF